MSINTVNSLLATSSVNPEIIVVKYGRIGSLSSTGTTATDTGIPINQFNGGSTMYLIASRNNNSGTGTDAAYYMIKIYYDGNNVPSSTYLYGDVDFVVFSTTGTDPNKTLTLAANSGGNNRFTWLRTNQDT